MIIHREKAQYETPGEAIKGEMKLKASVDGRK